jgi:hypothetical protein
MNYRVFYCWQSDLPNAANYSFIEKALENAARAIRDDETIQIEPDVDRDTKGVPGAPDIANTIFTKISESHAFVCDISIINTNASYEADMSPRPGASPRPTPNPNVLIELGYALKTLGSSRIILVFNTAYGELGQLPFDLHTKRVITYNMPGKLDDGKDRASERRVLEKKLESILRNILLEVEATETSETTETPSIAEQAIGAIENSQANQASYVAKFMKDTVADLDRIAPDFSSAEQNSELDELLIQSLEQTLSVVFDFSRLTEAIAAQESAKAAGNLYKEFGTLLELYNARPGNSSSYRSTDFDFFKFVGHELFVTFFASLVRAELWDLVADLLESDLFIRNSRGYKAEAVPFTYASQHVGLLAYRNDRLKLRRISLHADLLNARHSQGALGQLIPIQQFMEADYFLFLRSQLERAEDSGWADWLPWSTLYMRYTAPSYLLKARRRNYAELLLRPLGVGDIETMRVRLEERAPKLERFFGIWADVNPLASVDIESIATK